ncbi:MAG TPA: NAD-dependent epimerase/dehydratase family protein, partial [Methyloceanibacter sp.]|nr:NAD-dependent epimerase/dehydratase family protein [Methyloceanibacter sp.]
MKRTVLVTGASGFIGRSLVAALAKEGYPVRAAARGPEAIPPAAGVTPVALPDLARPVDWAGL